jgi:uncharacterized protein (TIGR03000 family)
MYSIVLATMLTTGSAAPAWGGCHGCHGCWGGCHGCYGCWGGCYGCWGGCWGGCYGCCGGCYGCYGCYGCWGCCGGCYGGYAYYPAYRSGVAVAVASPVAPASLGVPATASDATKATLIVQAPTDAQLFVDGRRVTTFSNGMARVVTPDLKLGQDYAYTLRADALRDGRVVSEKKRVTFQAGSQARVTFSDLTEAVTEKAAPTPSPRAETRPVDGRVSVNSERQ